MLDCNNWPDAFRASLQEYADRIERDCAYLATLREYNAAAGDLMDNAPAVYDDNPQGAPAFVWLKQRVEDIGEDAVDLELVSGYFADTDLGVRIHTAQWLGLPDSHLIERVDIILGTGGPHTEVRVWPQLRAELYGYWGSEHAAVRMGKHATSEAVRWFEYAEEVAL